MWACFGRSHNLGKALAPDVNHGSAASVCYLAKISKLMHVMYLSIFFRLCLKVGKLLNIHRIRALKSTKHNHSSYAQYNHNSCCSNSFQLSVFCRAGMVVLM